MAQLYANNATTHLAGGISSGATALTVTSGTGTLFPAISGGNFFLATLQEGPNIEIVKVTARTGDTMTIVRAQEGTSPNSFSTAAVFEMRVTAGTLNTFINTGSVLGVANGGTGQTSATTAFNALAPNQTGQANNFLKSNGSVASWAQIQFGNIAGTVGSGQLPNPSASTLGGVESFASVTHQFLTQIGTDGSITAAQPAFTDISGTATAAQLPTPTSSTIGGVKSFSATANQFLTQIGTDGSITAAQPSFSNISGLVGATQLPNPTATTLGGVQSIAAVTHNFLTSISTSGVPSSAQPASADLSDFPTQTGNTGKFLTTNGSVLSWGTVASGGTISGLTANRIPFASSPTALTDDSELNWDSTNHRLSVGTAGSPSYKLWVNCSSPNDGIKIIVPAGTTNNAQLVLSAGNEPSNGQGGLLQLNSASNTVDPNGLLLINRTVGPLAFFTNNTEVARFAVTTGNLLINTTTDTSNMKLKVVGNSTSRMYFANGFNNNGPCLTVDNPTTGKVAAFGVGTTGSGITWDSTGDYFFTADAAATIRGGTVGNSGTIVSIMKSTGDFIVGSAANANKMYVSNAGSVSINANGAAPQGTLWLQKSAAGALGGDLWINNSAAVTNGSIARLSFGSDGTTDSVPNNTIDSLVVTAGSFISDLVFRNYDGTALTEHMRIKSATGHLLVRTTTDNTPAAGGGEYVLQLGGLQLTTAANGQNAWALTNGSDSSIIISPIGSGQCRISTDQTTRWWTLGSDNRVDVATVRGGNFIVGTTTDNALAKFQVAGNSTMSGWLAVNGATGTSSFPLFVNGAGQFTATNGTYGVVVVNASGGGSVLSMETVGSGQCRLTTDSASRWFTLASDARVDVAAVRGGHFLIGSTTDSGSGAILQVTGNGSLTGRLGVNGAAPTSSFPFMSASAGLFYGMPTGTAGLVVTDNIASSWILTPVGSGQMRMSTDAVGRWISIADGAGATDVFAIRGGHTLIGTTTDNGVNMLQVTGSALISSTIAASNLSGTNTGNVTLTAVGAVPSANAASLAGQALTLQPADGTNPGVITAGTQTVGGDKTFTGTATIKNILITTNSISNTTNNPLFFGTNSTTVGQFDASGNFIVGPTFLNNTFLVDPSGTLRMNGIGNFNKAALAGIGGEVWIRNTALAAVSNSSRLAFAADQTIGSTPSASIDGIQTNLTTHTADILFKTFNGTSLLEGMRLTSSQKLGVQTTSVQAGVQGLQVGPTTAGGDPSYGFPAAQIESFITDPPAAGGTGGYGISSRLVTTTPTDPSGDIAAIYGEIALNGSNPTTGFFAGGDFQAINNASASTGTIANLYGVSGIALTEGAAGSGQCFAGVFQSFYAAATTTTGGVADDCIAVFARAESQGPAVISSVQGVHVAPLVATGVTAVDAFGVYVDDQHAGATNNWAYYYNGSGGAIWGINSDGKQISSFTDNTGSPGNNTANTTTGRCKIAASASQVVVTNSLVNTGTIVHVTYEQATEDATLLRLRVVPGSGSFTIYGNAAATADVQVSWSIRN